MRKTEINLTDLYDGITSEPDSWGMCCSEEMAKECAKYNDELFRKKSVKQFLFFVRSEIYTFIVLCIFSFLIIANIVCNVN